MGTADSAAADAEDNAAAPAGLAGLVSFRAI
jgi:hypothetical protein